MLLTANLPIIINNRDRLTMPQALVAWLQKAGHRNITILDNDSTYPPLLRWYAELNENDVRVLLLKRNLGSQALWKQQDKSLLRAPFVYTDPDIVPSDDCPLNLVDFLMRTVLACGHKLRSAWACGGPIQKIGPGFQLRDIPNRYALKRVVIAWENRHFGKQSVKWSYQGVDLHDAAIDTTFALYLNDDPFGLAATRTGHPYVARHLPWYVNSARPTPEDQYYESHADKGTTNWGIKTCYSPAVCRGLRVAR